MFETEFSFVSYVKYDDAYQMNEVRTLTFNYSSGLAVAFEASSRNPVVVKEPHGFTP